MVSVGPIIDQRWWEAEMYRGVPLKESLAVRDFGPIFSFLKARGWSVGAIASRTRIQEARVRDIISGRRKVTSYEVIERIATGLSIDRGLCGIGTGMVTPPPCRCGEASQADESMDDLIDRAGQLGPQALATLMAHTDHIRDLVHSLGVKPSMTALTAHLSTLSALRAFSMEGFRRRQLANVYHDAACLAAGLSLSMGEQTASWRHHEAAKDAARESGCVAAIAHSMRRQAALLSDHGQPMQASRLIKAIRDLSVDPLPEVARVDDPTHYHGRLYQGIT